MKARARLSLITRCAAVLPAAVLACLIPDRDIVIRNTCGDEWVASTAGAYGYNGAGEAVEIRTETSGWVRHEHCLTPVESAEVVDLTSDGAAALLVDIYERCQARASELGIVDIDESCASTADIAPLGSCYIEGGCSEGAETGAPAPTDEGEV